MDWQAYERDALSAVAAASAADELDDARVHAVGRKSELALALREVRDRDAGMLLNGVRQRIEEAVDGRRAELEAVELERRLAGEKIDVTLPGEEGVGHLHPTTQTRRLIEEAFLGLGYHVRDDREVETTEYNFDKLAFDPWHPARSHRATFFLDDRTVLRTETSPLADPRAGGTRAAALHGLDRPLLSARRDRRRTIRSSCSSRGSPSTRASRSPT